VVRPYPVAMRIWPVSEAIAGPAWMAVLTVGGIATATAIPAASPPGTADPAVDFIRDVRPILAAHCFACHGFDAGARKADLRLDTPEGAFLEVDGLAAIVPGDLERSLLWERITTDDPHDRMPPASTHRGLDPEEIATLLTWIEAGAPYELHWAFIAPTRGAASPAG
jgi:mono/diheme cytochrome c family protein